MARRLPRYLTPREVDYLLKVCKDKKHRMVMKSLFYLGLRNNELRNLLIDDIDLINRTVKVVQGKGKKDRYVPIPGKFLQDLKPWIKNSTGYLFTGRSSGMLSDRHIRRIVKKYAILAGIRKAEEIHPHTLRHSYATLLQNKGVPLNVIQETLGHESIETTTIYVHLGIERKKELIEKAFSTL